MIRTSAIHSTSCCGRRRRRASRPGTARGARGAGLAHRVLGDEHALPRADDRLSRRRRRPGLPAPRVRDRPGGSAHRPHALRPHLDAHGHGRARGRQDEQVAGQPGHGRRPAEALLAGRPPPLPRTASLPPALEPRSRRARRAAQLAAKLRAAATADGDGEPPEMRHRGRLHAAMDDDLDTPAALGRLESLADDVLAAARAGRRWNPARRSCDGSLRCSDCV